MAEKNEAEKKETLKSGAEKKNSTASPAAVVKKPGFDWTSLNTLSVVSIATALTSIGAVAAVITGHVSLAQIKRTGDNGRGLALAGVIIGYLTILSWISFLVIGSLISLRFGYQMGGMNFGELGNHPFMNHPFGDGPMGDGPFGPRGDR